MIFALGTPQRGQTMPELDRFAMLTLLATSKTADPDKKLQELYAEEGGTRERGVTEGPRRTPIRSGRGTRKGTAYRLFGLIVT